MEMDVLLEMVREWDTNNNGYINFEDFKAAMLPILNSWYTLFFESILMEKKMYFD